MRQDWGMADFRGFPPEALDFFVELEANNERSWWLANRDRFDQFVRDPMRALLDRLEPQFGTFRVFRMNRDVRFSKDKSPYKTVHGAMTETEGGALHYVHISSAGLYLGAGIYHAAPDQVSRLRQAVADDTTGPALETAIATVRAAGLDVSAGGEPPLRTAPRGFDRDHPRVELLRWKGCIALKDHGAPAWLHTRRVAERVAATWNQAAPIVAWLDAHVGASELQPAR
jgi:uncharacterized protein (TIGR02453 family)